MPISYVIDEFNFNFNVSKQEPLFIDFHDCSSKNVVSIETDLVVELK